MNQPPEDRPSVQVRSEPRSTGVGGIPWLPITNIVLLLLIILFLLLISMRIVLCPGGGPAKSEDNEFYIEIGKISQRTSDIQTALEANRQSEAQTFQNLQAKIDENTASIKELTDRVNELSKQLSKMQNGDNKAEVSRELKDVRENIAALKQGLTKLQSDSSKKAIGLINVDASH